MTTAIIVASGTSRRMGFDKLMANLAGQPVLAHSVRAFASCPEIDEIIVVTDARRFSQLDLSEVTKPLRRVDGGAERQDSVQSGLANLGEDCQWVAIHDGARPFISIEAITLTIQSAQESGAASLAHPVVETLKRSDKNGLITESISRENVWAMETPQCFGVAQLRKAYQSVVEQEVNVTDEVSVFQHFGLPVKLVQHPAPNTKITFPGDLP